MSGSAVDNDELVREAEGIRAMLSELHGVEESLLRARSEFGHELRRIEDALLRRGGRSTELEGQARRLRENIVLTRKDLDNNQARRQELEARLKDIEPELDRSAY